MTESMPDKPDDPTLIDELAEEADPAPVEYPDGAPELKPYLQIRPRSKRAEFKRAYAAFAKRQDTIAELTKAAKATAAAKKPDAQQNIDNMNLWADADDLYQEMDDLMRLAAVDNEKYALWSDEVEDQDLITTFQVFMQRSQPGEASGSAT